MTSLALTIGGGITAAVLSFYTYSLPHYSLLPPPFTGWTVALVGAAIWFAGLISAIIALFQRRTKLRIIVLIISLSAPALVIALATTIFIVGLSHADIGY